MLDILDYGDNQGIIADCVPENANFMDDVLPGRKRTDVRKRMDNYVNVC